MVDPESYSGVCAGTMPPDGVEFLPVGATRPGLADWQPATARAEISSAVMVKAFMVVSVMSRRCKGPEMSASCLAGP